MLRLKPFQTLGMKLRQFGLGRLRRYAQDLPVEQAEVEPNWQDASEQELNWPEGERPVEAGPEAEVQRFPEDYAAEYDEYGEYDAGEGFEESDDQPKRTPPDLAAILNAHREYQAEEPAISTEETGRRPAGGPGTRRVSRQAADDAGERTTPPAVLSDLPRPRRSRDAVIQELLGGRVSDADQAAAEASPALEQAQDDPEAFLQEEWTPDAPPMTQPGEPRTDTPQMARRSPRAPDQPEGWTPDAPMTQPGEPRTDTPQMARRSPREPASPEQPIRRQPTEPAPPRERGRDRQMAAGPVSISEEGEPFPAETAWTPPTEAAEPPGSTPAVPPGDAKVRRRPAPQPDPGEPMRRRIDRQPERAQSAPPQEPTQPRGGEAPRATRPQPESISEEGPGERPAPVRRQPASPEPPVSAGAPYYDAPAERSAPPLRRFEDADMEADTELIVPVTPPSSAVPPRSRPASAPPPVELPEEPRRTAPRRPVEGQPMRSEARPASPPEVVRRSPENAPDVPERPATRRAESPERPASRRSEPPQSQAEARRSEVRRAVVPPNRPAPEPVEADAVEDVGDEGGVNVHEVDLYQALLSQGLVEAEPPARPAADTPSISRREAPRPRTERPIQRQSEAVDDVETMARLRGRPAGEASPSGSSDAETMARLRRRPEHQADEAPSSSSTEQDDLMALLGLPPETPVVGGEVFQRPATPEIRRQPQSRPARSTPRASRDSQTSDSDVVEANMEADDLPEVQRAAMPEMADIPLDAAIAREPAAESAPEESAEGGEQPGEGGGEDVDIDKLARDVYTILRDRLRIEQERKSGRL